MKDAGSWPKDLVYTKCGDFTTKDAIVRPNLDLRQAMRGVSKGAVWPDLAKFRHFGKNLKVSGHFKKL